MRWLAKLLDSWLCRHCPHCAVTARRLQSIEEKLDALVLDAIEWVEAD